MNSFDIAKIISKKLDGSINEKEKIQLNNWLSQSNKNFSLFKELTNKEIVTNDLNNFKSFNVNNSWNKIQNKISGRKPKSEKRFNWYKVAASVILVLGVSVLSILFVISKKQNTVAESIKPGSYNAILNIDGKEQLALQKGLTKDVVSNMTKIARVNNGKLEYINESNLAPTKMEIIVPEKSEFQFTLSDGSKIWMNAGSKAVFYQPFNSSERNIFIEGEAYFEVNKDKQRPFKVDLNGLYTIEVLGTSFNTKTYTSDQYHQSVLVEGKIKWSNNSEEYIIEPGQVLTYNTTNKNISIKKTDTYQYTAWKDGRFVYDNQSLESIMTSLCRWYGVSIKFESEEIKNIGFSMDIKRYKDLNTVLKMLEVTNKVKFEINNKEVLIKEK